ncbi:unnamed protein product [Brassicogethes aeneus]|uniref:C2H2-type domain-containing protein n=1 Tax=Brassicogethes aeneus TaxID=1431903 RepID=A0A9P0BA50_BRAAE|nr:unnamed protein product [Brassicogethes aeneus]
MAAVRAKDNLEHFQCEVCKLTLSGKINIEAHLNGQKHKKNEVRQQQAVREKEKLDCGLFITGFSLPINQKLALDHFAKFGNIMTTFFSGTYLLLEYSKSAEAEMALKSEHNLQGKKLIVNKRKSKEAQVIQEEKNDPQLLPQIENVASFDQQLQILMRTLQPNLEAEFAKYHQICIDLKQALVHFFPQCLIYPFGSTISGVCFNLSDVDVYVENMRFNSEKDVKCLFKAKSALARSRRFANIIVIPKAKIPILKTVHVRTKINVDINCKNMLGVFNSQLIKYYIDVDSKRVKPLIMAIKYWAKVQKITGSNHLITNYSLCMLIIFYLQQHFSIPSVRELQRDPSVRHLQNGWNGAFTPIHCSNPLGNATTLELLKGFFTYYSTFKYKSHIICPYLGKCLEKSTFEKIETVPKDFTHYRKIASTEGESLKIDSAICLQDPFEHNRNTMSQITPVTLSVFTMYCSLAATICAEGETNLLHKLFTQKPEGFTTLSNTDEQAEFSLHKKGNPAYLPELNPMEINAAWFKVIVNYTKTVFRDLLLFSMEEICEPPTPSKVTKQEGQDDVHTNSNFAEKIVFKCEGKFDTWTVRKNIARTVASTKTTFLEKELELTEHLKNIYKGIENSSELIGFQLSIICKNEPCSVTIQIQKSFSHKKIFKTFTQFITSKFPHWFSFYEGDLLQRKITFSKLNDILLTNN